MLEERRRSEAAERARIDAEAERTVQSVRQRERYIVAAARQAQKALGVDVPLTSVPTLERAQGQRVPADWLAAAERALIAMTEELVAARRRGTELALARVAEEERAVLEPADDRELPAARTATVPAADAADASEAAALVASAERNLERLADANDLTAYDRGSAFAEGIVSASRSGDMRTARDLLARLRALVQQGSEARDRSAYDAARAGELRDHLLQLHGDGDAADHDAHPEWAGHLSRVVLGLEPLDLALARRISDHIIAESFAVALESQGYTVGTSFAVDLAEGGPAAAWRDSPEHDGHAVRFSLLPGSVIDFAIASDASVEVDEADFAELERRWCDEDLPVLAAALELQGVTMSIDERSLPGERPPQRVEGLRAEDLRRTSGHRRAEQPRAKEVRG